MKYFNFIAALLLILVYLLAGLPPSERFNLWVVSFIIPFALLINIIMMIMGLVLKKKSSLFLVVALFYGLVSPIGDFRR